ncbi:hypothetical protein G6F58_013157 [Rhizopus delemar]|nr:hypothetical protein G6F58_013157 [Rhizopus delemar]
MPLAYSAPTTLPALVPDTTTGSKPLASNILITPMWAKPLAAPPPSAMPIFTGLACGTTVAGQQADQQLFDHAVLADHGTGQGAAQRIQARQQGIEVGGGHGRAGPVSCSARTSRC